MNLGEARARTRDWVSDRLLQDDVIRSHFVGASFAGSTVELPDDASIPTGSDLDTMIWLDVADLPRKPGKRMLGDALVEFTLVSLPEARFSGERVAEHAAERLLRDIHLSGLLKVDAIFSDSKGLLHDIHRIVSRSFSEARHVRSRLEHVRTRIRDGLSSMAPDASMPVLVQSWLFPTGMTCHLILAAALKNPTVRLRYVRSREVLVARGMADFHEDMLNALGCAQMTPERVLLHLDRLGPLFDAASCLSSTSSLPFRSDISPFAREAVFDCSRALIAQGLHREAVFWVAVTFARCHLLLLEQADVTSQLAFEPDFLELMSDLGAGDAAALMRRREEVLGFLPACMEAAERIAGLQAAPEART